MADGLDVDRDGRLYVATRFGVQICDQAGKVQAILPTPNRKISNIAIGGANFDILYATCGDKVYRRKLECPRSAIVGEAEPTGPTTAVERQRVSHSPDVQ
jgi:sugar lactone lactonase YvrE